MIAQRQLCCPKHPEEMLVEDYTAGDLICPRCGLVVGERLVDVSSEWRTFGKTDKESGFDRSRVGAPENEFYDDANLSTNIQQMPRFQTNGDGKAVYGNRKLISASDRRLMDVFSSLSQLCDRLNLPNGICNTGKRILKQLHESKNVPSRNVEALVGACLYIACRQEQVPRTLKEICAVCQASKKEISRVCRQIIKKVNAKRSVPMISSTDYLERFARLLELPHNVIRMAREISQHIATLDLCRNHFPISVAATVLLMATKTVGANKRQKH